MHDRQALPPRISGAERTDPDAINDREIRTIVRQLLLYAALTRGHDAEELEGT